MGDYHKSRRMSVSKLKVLANDPVEFKMRYVDDPATFELEPTEAMIYGSALHCAFLEPHKFDDQFAVAPKVDRRTKAGKEQFEEFSANVNGRTVIDHETYLEVIEATQQLRAHPIVSSLMLATTPDWIERGIEFIYHGIEFQCKPDAVIPSAGVILDLKTVADARPQKWKYHVADFGYHLQAAAYRYALYMQTGEWYRFIFIAIEKRTASTRGMPFKIALYELDDESMIRGENEMFSLVEDYRLRVQSNDWSIPYCNEIVSVQIPNIPFGFRKDMPSNE